MFLALFQPLSPIVVKVEGEVPKDIGVIDIIFGSFGVIGVVLVGSAVLGLLLGALIIGIRRRISSREPSHAPSSAYGFTPSSAPDEPRAESRQNS